MWLMLQQEEPQEDLHGDPGRAKALLGWKPRVSFDELVARMVDYDLELARQEKTLRDAGHAIALRGLASE
jgi:GDPmannose 4,6-dehydratase